MYLKRISLSGFKSFPDRVDFDFSPGVTCIVGPNGCGKSNLVDAFKWVLGEQSAKSLRGRQMTDMIFNGSATRRSSGMAQVDLYFDNTDRVLALDRDEVGVTRKLYRSGESEYLINKETVRLKDIRDLFLDTGVGADSYSVIEQGQVGRLLEASTTERRALFEEAAGIGRYKTRKREAMRKLERCQQNMFRINDIIEEVQRHLRSVKLQAGKARRFKQYDGQLRELRAGFSLAEYHRLTQTIARHQRALDETTDESTAIRTDIDRNEAETANLSDLVNRLSEELSGGEQDLMGVRSDMATHEERIDAARKRIEEHKANRERVDSRLGQLQEQRSEHESRLAEIQEAAVALEHQTREHEVRIRELSEKDRLLTGQLTEAQASLDDEKEGLVDLVRRSTQLRNEIASLNAHREKLESQHSRLGRRDATIRAELEDYLAQKYTLELRVKEIDTLLEAETACLAQKHSEAQDLDSRRAGLTKTLGVVKEERSGLRSRLSLLDELHVKMEGVGAAVRSLLEQKLSKPGEEAFKGIKGMVGEMFDADVVHAGIIEAAIGELDQYLVLSDSSAFLSHGDLFENLPGRLSAICLDRLPPVINEDRFASHPGFVANAVDLVRYEDGFERLAKHLLGKTVVVETLEHALALSKTDPSERRFVTLAGELVEPNGCVSVGPPSSRAGLIARKSERRKIAEELEEVEARICSLTDQLDRTAIEAAHLDKTQQELRAAIGEANTAKVEAKASLERVNEAVRRLSEEQPLISGEVVLIGQQITETTRKAREDAESVNHLDKENQRRERAIVSLTERIETLSEERERVQFLLTEARIAFGKLAEKRTATAESIDQLRCGLRAACEAVDGAAQDRKDALWRIAQSEEVILGARQRLDELAIQGQRLEAACVQLRRQREMIHLESEKLAAQTKAHRRKLEETESRLHQFQLEMQTATVQSDELTSRVKEDLGLNLLEMYASYNEGEQDLEAVEAEIAELRQKLERLGNVNLDAINELAELEEREHFLTTQHKDIEDSGKQLEALIRKLDAESLDRFTKAFEAIRKNFRELFRKLFGGGKADVILEDPNDPLGCGIEILAKPPGKEMQRITLMSGGEKTLTAIALVMSIFRSQPSPFAFLDEVDAALDEANNTRFNNLIGEFLDSSQFIIVTHSKKTMSIAETLYGITMQEPGISARVSVKFEQDASTDQHAVA